MAVYNEIASSGVRLGGEATASPWQTYLIFGGAVSSGTTPILLEHIVEIGGGIISGASATILAEYFVENSGSALLSGEAVLPIWETYPPSGGAEAGSAASFLLEHIVPTSGGIVAGGLTESPSGYTIGLSGGIEAAGLSEVLGIFTVGGLAGNAKLGGSAVLSPWQVYPVSGGIEIAGTLEIQETLSVIGTSNGTEIAGSAIVTAEYAVIGTSNGAELNSTTIVDTILVTTLTGGALLNSSAPFGLLLTELPDGDIQAAGLSGITSSTNLSGIAGIEAGGDGIAEFGVIALGGAVVGGLPNEDFYDDVETFGGAVLGGTPTLIEYWQNYGSGGAELAGEGNDNKVQFFTDKGYGYVTIGGTLDFWHTLTHQVDGNVSLSGSGTVEITSLHFALQVNGIVTTGGGATTTINAYTYTSNSCCIFIGGQGSFKAAFGNRDCGNALACNVNYPNNYVECFRSKTYDPRQGKGRTRWNGRAATLPAITACRQYLYLPSQRAED